MDAQIGRLICRFSGHTAANAGAEAVPDNDNDNDFWKRRRGHGVAVTWHR